MYFFSLAVPIIIQNFMAASLNLIDNIMVGRLGDVSIAGVGLGNQVFFVLQLFFIGISTGGGLFTAQFLGKNDRDGIKKVLGFTLIVGISVSTLYFLIVSRMPGFVIALFTGETAVIKEGSAYLGTVAWSYPVTAFNLCVAAVLRSVKRVRQPMTANIAGIITNTIGNYLLIFGHAGLPALGVRGAAIATIMARLVESGILVYFLAHKRHTLPRDIRVMFSFKLTLVKRFFNLTSLMIIKDVIWGLGVTFYMAIYGRMGTEIVASFNIVQAVRQLSFIMFQGYAAACMIIISNLLGASRFKRATRDVGRVMKITLVTAVVSGLLLILARPLFLLPYAVSEAVKTIVYNLLFIYGFLSIMQVYNMVIIMGVLRSGGDVRFTLFMDLTAVYAIGLPLGFVAWKFLGLNIYWVFILINLQELYKLFIVIARLHSKKWQRNLVHDLP